MSTTPAPVSVVVEQVNIPTYEPMPPDRNPMFLEKRVYQGSNGCVYPLPVYDRIADTKTDHAWTAVYLENEFVKVMLLPEIGGRIHAVTDKTNGYDIFYRQNVIKPALVGLAGPWASGGVEFNWPQHHRPATFMPVNHFVEKEPDGSVTVWMGDHDPLTRMKGMHGVRLSPGKSYIEVRVRAHNRTDLPQTFLWWANVAARVHESYQSFFPPDVYYIADHAKRAMSEYPLCDGHYYGVDYAARGKNGVSADEIPTDFVPAHCRKNPGDLPRYAANDLSWYANIPVPTSYMCMGSKEDFFGGYDYARRAGFVHIANHHISPGKKQWTWGNHEFGYAWDRNLTDEDGPYIELMAGVYTDNQPDFSFLQPGETKTWSQYWYPIRDIGSASHANLDAAVSLTVEGKSAKIGVSVSSRHKKAKIVLMAKDKKVFSVVTETSPGKPFSTTAPLAARTRETDLRLVVTDAAGRTLIAYQPKKLTRGSVPPAATEPPAPEAITSADELFVTGLHLAQYRHATRCPTLYWREALRRDAGDSRCNNALGMWHYKRGEFVDAEKHLRTAIARLTLRNPNPYDGEPYYNLGLTLLRTGRAGEAYEAFYKSAWNMAWQAPAYHEIAKIDTSRSDWATALDHLDRSLRFNTDNLAARNLKAVALAKLGRTEESKKLVAETLALDPIDHRARRLAGLPCVADSQTRIDLALEHAAEGLFDDAIELLRSATPEPVSGTAPMLKYHLASVYAKLGDKKAAAKARTEAAKAPSDYCFPSRLDDIAALEAALAANPKDARAAYYLGNLFYDRRRHREAIALWEKAVAADAKFAGAWRNLGIGYFNILAKPDKAVAAYDKAVAAGPKDARLLYERDQLMKRLGVAPETRLRELEKRPALVSSRDDLSVEHCALLNRLGRHAEALKIVSTRKFQPWEGGEGLAMGRHVRTHLALGDAALAKGDAKSAREHYLAALDSPHNLGEAKHLLSNLSDIHYRLGNAADALGDKPEAKRRWTAAANFKGDFQEMSVRAYSEMTYYSAISLEKLGRKAEATKLLKGLFAYSDELEKTPAKIDYFATSLPTMLLFDDDLNKRQATTAKFLRAQAKAGLGDKPGAKKLLAEVLRRDPNHEHAAELSRALSAKK